MANRLPTGVVRYEIVNCYTVEANEIKDAATMKRNGKMRKVDRRGNRWNLPESLSGSPAVPPVTVFHCGVAGRESNARLAGSDMAIG